MATKAGNLRGGKEIMPAYNNFVCVCVFAHARAHAHPRKRVRFLCVSMCQGVLWVSVLVCVYLYQVLMSACLNKCFYGSVYLWASLSF